jgi:hypothetical protein
MKHTYFLMLLALLASLSFLGGCDSSDAAKVTGIVTLDEEPLADAKVVFQPEEGRPSMAMTDEEGYYELQYTVDEKGAKVGMHKISITSGGQRLKGDGSSSTISVPEKVPAKYNKNTELEREVKPGNNEINFELST